MSDNGQKLEKYFGEEIVEGNTYKINFSIPPEIPRDNIKIKYKKNGFFIEYNEEQGKEENGWTYHSTSKGYYSRTYPFEMVGPKAKFEENRLVFTFEKGEEISSGYNSLTLDSD